MWNQGTITEISSTEKVLFTIGKDEIKKYYNNAMLELQKSQAKQENHEDDKTHIWNDSKEFLTWTAIDLAELTIKQDVRDKLLKIPKFETSTMVKENIYFIDWAKWRS